MKFNYKSFVIYFTITLLLFALIAFYTDNYKDFYISDNEAKGGAEQIIGLVAESGLSSEDTKKIDDFVREQMGYGKIPGLSIVIVSGNEILYSNEYGYADKKTKRVVTADTLFELGSNSDAFTALGILLLEEQGLINISDSVQSYIPWFEVSCKKKSDNSAIEFIKKFIPNYSEEKVDITIEQLLNHTSGIPYKTFFKNPIGSENMSLDNKVQKIVLDYYPGDRYQYASVNYDVLGLIIQNITGQTPERFIKENILKPLALNNTCLNKEATYVISKGYKIGFGVPIEFNTSIYRGNTSAEHFLTNSNDMARWVMLQLGTVQTNTILDKLIKKSHQIETAQRNSYYQNGWEINRGSTWIDIFNSGNNPNYSSYIAFRPQDNLGIAVLSNMNSEYIDVIGIELMNFINGRGRTPELLYDSNIDMDNICMIVIAIGIFFIVLSIRNLFQKPDRNHIIKKKCRFKHRITKVFPVFIYSILFYCLPTVFFNNWSFILEWAPISLPIACFTIYISVVIFHYQYRKKLSWKRIKNLMRYFSRFLKNEM